MESLDPLLQYGPNDGGYAGILQIAGVAFAVLVGSWLFGAVYALITNVKTRKEDEEREN